MPAKRNITDLLNQEEEQTEQDAQPPTNLRRLHSPSPPHTLPYTPATTAATPTPPFQQPLPLLTFSYTPARTLEFTDSALRSFVDPPAHADLNYGVERWVRRPEERGRVDGLVEAWGRMRDRGGEVGVVCWRGVLTKILTAPYETRDEWELNVMCEDGTMYFEEHLSHEKVREKNNVSPHHRLQSYYGYAFESWCTTSTVATPVPPNLHTRASAGGPSSAPHPTTTPTGTSTSSAPPIGWGGDVDTNVQWCCVVKTKLGGTRMVIGGEVDCVRGRYTGRTDNFVELKTSLVIRNAYDEGKFEKKLLKFYFQSFLLGVPEIVVGFRTREGMVSAVQRFRTVGIPRAIRERRGGNEKGDGSWDPGVCLMWGERFLEFLKGVVCGGGEKGKEREKGPTVWRVGFRPNEGVSVRVLDEEEVEDVRGGEDRIGFLPRSFLEKSEGR